jgi:hypothetical protein
LIETKAGYTRFWSEWETAFDEPFRSYVINLFAKNAALETPKGENAGLTRTDWHNCRT